MRRIAFSPAAALLACMSPVEAQELRYDTDDPARGDGRIVGPTAS